MEHDAKHGRNYILRYNEGLKDERESQKKQLSAKAKKMELSQHL